MVDLEENLGLPLEVREAPTSPTGNSLELGAGLSDADDLPVWLRKFIYLCQKGEANMKACVDSSRRVRALLVQRTTDEGDNWVMAIFTDPGSRRQGLARQLLMDAVAATPSNRITWSCIPPRAFTTQRLLEALEFKHVVDVMAWPGWQTACALHLSLLQGLSIDMLVMHPNETGDSIAMAEHGKQCRSLDELQEALEVCSPAPEGLRHYLPGERRLTGARTGLLVEALAADNVWLVHDRHRRPAAVLTSGQSHSGMIYGSIVARDAAGLEAALRLARRCIPYACRFYFLASCPPLKLMMDQVTATGVWARPGTGTPVTPRD